MDIKSIHNIKLDMLLQTSQTSAALLDNNKIFILFSI